MQVDVYYVLCMCNAKAKEKKKTKTPFMETDKGPSSLYMQTLSLYQWVHKPQNPNLSQDKARMQYTPGIE